MKDLDQILSLLDDSDEPVVRLVDRYVIGRGYVFLDLLKSSLDDIRTRKNSRFLDARMDALVDKYVSASFRRAGTDLWVDPYLFFLNTIVTPSLTKETYDGAFSAIVNDVLAETNANQTAMEKLSIFNHIFTGRYRIRIGKEEENPNGIPSLYNVFMKKKSSPFMVIVAYFLVARMSGLSLFPVSIPSQGFSIVYAENRKPVILMRIDGGEFSMLAADQYYETMKGILPQSLVSRVLSPEYADRVLIEIYCEILLSYFSMHNRDTKVQLVSEIRKNLKIGTVL